MRTLVGTGLATVAAATLGARGTDPASGWYRDLATPSWQPPPLAFPLVWTPLYVAIALGSARMIDAEPDRGARRRLAALLGVDLAVNAAWSWTFFRARRLGAAAVVIGALDVLNVVLVRAAARRDRRAAATLAPYAVWTAFATALTVDLWRRNP